MHLQIAPHCFVPWEKLEVVNLRRRLALLVEAPPESIAPDFIPEVSTHLRSRTGHDVLQVDEQLFVPIDAIRGVFLNERLLHTGSNGLLDIHPAYVERVRAFCHALPDSSRILR